MKDYREMAENILQRRDTYKIERRKKMKKAVSVMSVFCVMAVLAAGGRYGMILAEDASRQVGDVKPQIITNRDTNDGSSRPTAEQETDQGIVQETNQDTGQKTKQNSEQKNEQGSEQGNKQDAGQETKQNSGQENQNSAINDLSEGKNDVDSAKKSEGSESNGDDSSKYSNNGEAKSTGTETSIDVPVSDIPGDTGARTAYDEVWGGCYMDQNGCWVVWLTEDTPENRQMVLALNPSRHEDNIIFKTAAYSKAYLTYLMTEISNAMCAGKLPLVTTAALREDKNCVEVTMISDEPYSVDKVLAFDTTGGAIEIIYDSESHVILDLEEYGIMDLRKDPEP